MTNKKITFICVGAQKAGTTTLHNILRQHSEIFLPQDKEIPFFHDDNIFQKGIEWWLKENYDNVKHEKAIGVINPEYLFFPKACERIYKHLGPDIKIIIILRNPVERAYSHYMMNIRRGIENLSFEDALSDEKNRFTRPDYKEHYSYISRSLYSSQIKRFLTTFSKENFLFLSFENDIVKDRDLTLKKIEDFLEVDHENINVNIKSNASKESIFPSINKIIFGKNKIVKFVANILFSKKMKHNIATKIYNINIKTNSRKKVDEKTKKRLMKKYFKEDFYKTKKLL